jgi:hypothetical protein
VRTILKLLVDTFTALEAQIAALDAEINERSKTDPTARRLMTSQSLMNRQMRSPRARKPEIFAISRSHARIKGRNARRTCRPRNRHHDQTTRRAFGRVSRDPRKPWLAHSFVSPS